VEAPLAGADLADALQELIEVVLAEALVQFQALVVEDEALHDELAQCLRGPDAELCRFDAVHAVADRDDGVEVVKVDLARDLAVALQLNSSNFSNSSLLREFAGGEDLLQVVADGGYLDAEEVGNAGLVQPEGLALGEDLDAGGALRRAVEDDVAIRERGGVVVHREKGYAFFALRGRTRLKTAS